MILRPYQEEIIERARSHMRNGFKRVLIQSPTGSGKTVLVAHMLKTAASKGLSSWFIVHRRELINQSCNTFDSMEIKYDIIASGYPETDNAKIKICSIQTLIRRINKYKDPSLIVWDECHHVAAGTWSTIHDKYEDKYHIGLTATPERLDGKGLKHWFDVIVSGPSVRLLIERGFLSDYKIYAPFAINTSGVKKQYGDFKKADLEKAANTRIVTGNAIAEYKKLANNKKAIIFCCSIQHSKDVVKSFTDNGISAIHVDGDTPKVKRDESMEMFRDGRVNIISNCDLFGEGLDIPGIEVAILLRPTQSLGLHLQQVGRSLRPLSGKHYSIILDHAGNSERHGLPDDIIDWSLDGRIKKKSKQIVVRKCKACYAVQRPGKSHCIYCGEEFPVKPIVVEELDGELREVVKRLSIKRNRKEQGSARSRDELVQIAKKRGYKNPHGWAYYVYNSRKKKKMAYG